MQSTFAEVVERIETLSIDEKETLVDLLQHRLAEFRRDQLINEIKTAEKEFENGQCRTLTVDRFMHEVML